LISAHRSGDTGSGPNLNAPTVGTQSEVILKQGEQYVFQVQTFAAIFVTLSLFWHEDDHS
jgi:hypothetical protein